MSDELNEIKSRATPDEYQAKLDTILSLIDKGMSKAQVTRHLINDLHFPHSERHCRRMFDAAMDQLKEQASQVSRAERFTRVLRRLEFLYGESVTLKDIKTALAVLRQEIELLRLSEPGAMNVDEWRTAAAEAGIDASKLFEQMVVMFAQDANGKQSTTD